MRLRSGAAVARWAGLTLAGLVLCACTHQQLLSPLARAFGAPPESELVKCRAGLRRMQADLPSCRIRVEPVMYAAGGESRWRSGGREWCADLARAIASEMRPRTKATLEVDGAHPGLRFPEGMWHNQLGYLWSREKEYEAWVRSSPSDGRYRLFAELFSGQGRDEAAVQIYLFNPEGQVVMCELRRFRGRMPGEDPYFAGLVAKAVAATLELDPDYVFPPYGVG